jgi:O-antigen/teichoic acid export membrane protein
MIRSAFFTFSVKVLTAVLNFFIAVITARYLGAEGRGVISVFVLNVSIVFMVCSLVGGPGLVYLAPRREAGRLMGASLFWALVSCAAVPLLIRTAGFVSPGLMVHLMLISLIHFTVRIHQNWLLAKQKIRAFNGVGVIHPVMMSVLLVIFFVVMRWHDVMAFVTAYYLAAGAGLLVSSAYLVRHGGFRLSADIRGAFTASFRLGYLIQAGNLLQLLNYRFSYYLLQVYFGKVQVGLFSMATAFTEASWMVANSFATIQYSRIANSEDDQENVRITVTVMRLALWLTLIPVIVLLALPPDFFRFFLSDEFSVLPEFIPWLAPGILFVVISIAVSHYYSGSGNPRVGLAGSAAGFAATLAAGFILVPAYGLLGAAITASLSYAVSAITVLIIFTRKNKLGWADFVLSKRDLEGLKELAGKSGKK